MPQVDTAATFFEPAQRSNSYTAMHENGDIEQIPAAFTEPRNLSTLRVSLFRRPSDMLDKYSYKNSG